MKRKIQTIGAIVALLLIALVMQIFLEKKESSEQKYDISFNTKITSKSVGAETFQTDGLESRYIKYGLGKRYGFAREDDSYFIFKTTVAHNEELREKGLGGRESLAKDEAMLFVFDYDNLWSFWMKDMKFPIDMIWLDADQKVVHFESNVSPDTYPQSFRPTSLARYVLEVKAGMVQEMQLELGDQFVKYI